MGLFSRIFGRKAAQQPDVRAEGQAFSGLTDPGLLEFIRSAGTSTRSKMETAAVFRCINLIAGSLAMLPARIMQIDESGHYTIEARDHPLWARLAITPNMSQTAYAFKKLMTVRMLTRGNGYAQIVRVGGVGSRIAGLRPLDPSNVTPRERDDGTIEYDVRRKDGGIFTLPQDQMLHVFDASLDGVKGISILELAADAIGLSEDTRHALGRLYKTGILASGALEHPNKLSAETKQNLRAQLEEKFGGAANSGRWLVLDEGIKANPLQVNPRDGQMIETVKHSVEDIARFFGVPRPLLGLDDTSWGSGVEQLATLFVRFGLSPIFVCWEQALIRALLTPAEQARFTIDIDERELLRGSMKDQGEFFARALGSGGHRPWMEPNEVRDLSGLARKKDGGGLQPAQQIKGN